MPSARVRIPQGHLGLGPWQIGVAIQRPNMASATPVLDAQYGPQRAVFRPGSHIELNPAAGVGREGIRGPPQGRPDDAVRPHAAADAHTGVGILERREAGRAAGAGRRAGFRSGRVGQGEAQDRRDYETPIHRYVPGKHHDPQPSASYAKVDSGSTAANHLFAGMRRSSKEGSQHRGRFDSPAAASERSCFAFTSRPSFRAM
jgi:hypothetical protein